MTRVALKGLAGRKLRALLTAFAIVLGVAMISGTYVLTDTMGKAFDGIFTSSYDETDVVVSGKPLVQWSTSGNATVPASLLPKIEAVPGVEAAAGTMMDLAAGTDEATIIGSGGEPIVGGGPTFGFGLDPSEPRFNPLALEAGRWAVGADEVVIDAGTAHGEGFAVGDRIEVAASGPVHAYELVGVARFGDVDSIGDATFAVFDLATAQRLYDKGGRFNAISVAAKEGVSADQLIGRIAPLLPETAQVRSGEAQAAADGADVGEFLKYIRYGLLAFGGIALFVGGFVIFNTISITVAQRTRELATLRTLGASRRQVLRSVMLESLALGGVASLAGLGLGLALAVGLNALLVAFGLDLPTAATVLAPRTVVVSLVVGTAITVLAGLFPAIRATRVPPIAAVREGAQVTRQRARSAFAGGAFLALGVGLMSYSLFVASGAAPILLGLIVGGVAVFVGVALVASRLVKSIAAVVGLPASRLGGAAGRLARENATRNPGRTAATAAALMIGLALVTTVSVLGTGLRKADENAIAEQLAADYVLTSEDGSSSLPLGAGERLRGAPGVEVASSVRGDRGLVGGSDVDVNGVDPATIGSVIRFAWSEGSDASVRALDRDEAIVQETFAEEQSLHVGSRLALRTPAGRKLDLTVAGIYDPSRFDSLLGQVVLSTSGFDASFSRPQDVYTFVDLRPGADPAAIERALGSFPEATVRTADEFIEKRMADFTTTLNMLYALLGLSVIVSLFGMVNTLVLSVFERTRELGMLRAVGMTRRQARRMIRHESVITALIGAALGLPLGIGFAALVTEAMRQYEIGLTLPVGTLVVFTLVTIVAGIAAAIFPARRASRLDVLHALQYE